MPAMNGFAVSSRSMRRLIGCSVAAVLLVSALFASSASAAKAPLAPTNYIALGDSISYGYSQQKFEENYPAESPSAFEGGFVNLLTKRLASLEKKSGNALTSINLSCPGEVSDGLIGENPAIGGGQQANGASDSAPCGWHNVDGFPRHFESGPVSQLEAAIGIVTTPATCGTAKYVTLQIGSNDELAVVHACETPAYLEAHAFAGGAFECLLHEAGEEGYYYEKGLFHHVIANVGDTIGVLRAEGFTGEVGVLGFYNPQALILPGSDTLQQKLNESFEAEIGGGAFGPGVVYANPFPKLNPQKGNKAESKAICKFTEECNTHDKYVDFVKYLESKGSSKAEAEAYAEAHKAEAEAFPEGDIHPTPAGHKYFAKILFEALTTGKSVG